MVVIVVVFVFVSRKEKTKGRKDWKQKEWALPAKTLRGEIAPTDTFGSGRQVLHTDVIQFLPAKPLPTVTRYDASSGKSLYRMYMKLR